MNKKRALFSTASALAPLHSIQVFAQQAQGPPASPPPPWQWYGPGHMWGMGWGFGWLMPLMMLFWFLVFGLLIWLLVGRGWRGPHHWGPWHMMGPGGPWRDPTHSALQILNERYAKGEINKAEYEERKAVILAGRGGDT